MSATIVLPPGFLSGPGPKTEIQKIDFTQTALPENAKLYAVVLDNVFTAEECAQLVAAAEARTDGVWEAAMINIGMGMQELRLDARNCGRIIWDDETVVKKIWNQVKSSVPEIDILKNAPLVTGNGPAKGQKTWHMTRLNERMRFLREAVLPT
ncbi:hypothetical protein MMC13_000331 [Lambiella insularis]|nr:hypothetical protein [Lambiella insularis]